MHNFKQHLQIKMSLQQLAICTHLDNILMDRQDKLTDLEQEFKEEFIKVADAALATTSCSSPNQYKMAYSLYFLKFYNIFKLVLAEYSLIAPDCAKITFQDVPAIKQIIENFDTNYHQICRPHSNFIPTM